MGHIPFSCRSRRTWFKQNKTSCKEGLTGMKEIDRKSKCSSDIQRQREENILLSRASETNKSPFSVFKITFCVILYTRASTSIKMEVQNILPKFHAYLGFVVAAAICPLRICIHYFAIIIIIFVANITSAVCVHLCAPTLPHTYAHIYSIDANTWFFKRAER